MTIPSPQPIRDAVLNVFIGTTMTIYDSKNNVLCTNVPCTMSGTVLGSIIFDTEDVAVIGPEPLRYVVTADDNTVVAEGTIEI